MYKSIAAWKRIVISAQILILLLFVGIDVFAQEQPNNTQTQQERIQTIRDIQAANDNYYERRYAEAIKAYQALLKKEITQNQKDSMRLMLGQSYAKLGEDKEARSILKEIVDENPDGSYASQAVHQLSNLYSMRYKYKEAIILCKQIQQQHPKSSAAAVAAYLTAYHQYLDGNSEDAITSYKHFLDEYPTSIYRSAAVSGLVRLYTRNQQFAEAEKLIKERVKLNPSDTTLLEELATLYHQQGQSQKALELYVSVLEKNPANTSMRRKLGNLYAELGKKEQAIAEWKKSVIGSTSQYQQLGSIYLSHKMYPEAVKAFQQAIGANPSYSYLYIQLASVYNIQGDIDKAASTYLDGLQSVGPSASQRDAIWQAVLEIYEGDRQKPLREKLIAQYEKVYQSSPRNLNNALTLGELYFYADQHDKALQTFTQTHRIYSTYVDATLKRCANYLQRKQHPAAIDFYKTLLQLSRNNRYLSEARYALASIYENTEQWEEAAEVLKEMNKNSTTSINGQVLLAQIQLHGLHDPKAAQMTLQPLIDRKVLSTQHIESQLVLGECHLLLKRYTVARQVLTPIADSNGWSSASAFKLIGDTYFFASEFDNATAEYRKVLSVSTSDKLTNDALEQIVLIQSNTDFLTIPLTDYANALQLHLSGSSKAAITQCEDTISLYPNAMVVDDLWMLLGSIYISQKAYGDAIHSYKQVVAQESSLAAEALTQIADIYNKKKDYKNAADTYTTLLTTYPDNSIVPHVRQQLDKITKLMDTTNHNSP